jgi:hypothetical protein
MSDTTTNTKKTNKKIIFYGKRKNPNTELKLEDGVPVLHSYYSPSTPEKTLEFGTIEDPKGRLYKFLKGLHCLRNNLETIENINNIEIELTKSNLLRIENILSQGPNYTKAPNYWHKDDIRLTSRDQINKEDLLI